MLVSILRKQYEMVVPLQREQNKDGNLPWPESVSLMLTEKNEYSVLSLPAPAPKSMAHPNIIKIGHFIGYKVDTRN
jgi:hypothetical protein